MVLQGHSQASPAEATGVAVGDVIAGKYRIERILGQGGMGMVVAATHIELDQLVAIKFLLPAATANKSAVERFAREARASAKLRSDNVVHVTDVGTLDAGGAFIVMEYLEGKDLGRLLEENGPLAVEDAVDYVLQACAALAEAHAAGIIHRDLKPANLFLAERQDTVRVVKVVDFGISKVMEAIPAGGQITNTRDLMGSPLYMSPEQLSMSQDIDGRADIWSLGIILYELIAGHQPFRDEGLPQLCTAILVRAAPPIERADLPAGLAAVIARCLEKAPAARYADIGDFATALGEFAPEHSGPTLARITRLGNVPDRASGTGEAKTVPPGRRDVVTGPHQETTSPWAATELKQAPPSGKRVWIVGAVVVAAVIALGVIVARSNTSPAAPAAPPPPPPSATEKQSDVSVPSASAGAVSAPTEVAPSEVSPSAKTAPRAAPAPPAAPRARASVVPAVSAAAVPSPSAAVLPSPSPTASPSVPASPASGSATSSAAPVAPPDPPPP